MPKQVFDSDLNKLIPLDQAIAESVFQKEFSQLKEDLKEQKDLNKQIIIGVCVAFLFTVGLAAIDVMWSHKDDGQVLVSLQRDFYRKIEDVVKEQSQLNQNLMQKISNIRPYCFKK